MLYDLHIPWSSTTSIEVQRTISLLSEFKYSVIALNHNITGAIPSQVVNPIPNRQSFKVPGTVTIIRRCTLTISDPALNHRLPILASAYDLLALRPTNEKAFMAACNTLDNYSIISLDLTIRYPFHFRPKHFMTAIRRGIRFEICYAQAVQEGAEKRRNFISNTFAIVRATGGRGLIVSSEARTALGVRAPADVENLLNVWGLGRERAIEAMTDTPRITIANEVMRRSGYSGMINVVAGDERAVPTVDPGERLNSTNRNTAAHGVEMRKHGKTGMETVMTPPSISKRQAKRMRLTARSIQKQEELSSLSTIDTTQITEAQAADKAVPGGVASAA